MKTVISIISLVVALNSPAFASKYACEFQKSGTSLHKCNIDSSNSSTQTCQYHFSTNLVGICGVQSGSSDLLLCAITTPVTTAASVFSGLPQESVASATRALAQKPGFVAGGLTIAPPNAGVIAGAYVEQQGAQTLAGVCTPQ